MIPTLSALTVAPKQVEPPKVSPLSIEKPRVLPEKETPTGPPPTFEESFLARQAREALKPPEMPLEADTNATGKLNTQTRAENGFAELRALSAEPAPLLMDKRS